MRSVSDLHPFPSHAELRRRSEEQAARVMKPFNAWILCAACAALLAAFTMTLVEINRLDREYELAERV